MHHRLHLLAISTALGLAACTGVPVARTVAKTDVPIQPALTAQTLNSGGVMPAEQARLHFAHAELHFTIDPAGQSIDASATLSFTAKSATDVLLLDLDRNLPISAIELDGKPLAASAWSNPDGRLRIALPAPLATGGKVSTTIHYRGKPPPMLQTYDSLMIIMDDFIDDIRFSARVVRMDKMQPGSKFDHLTIPVIANINLLKAEIGKFVADVAPDRVAELAAPKKATQAKNAPKP